MLGLFPALWEYRTLVASYMLSHALGHRVTSFRSFGSLGYASFQGTALSTDGKKKDLNAAYGLEQV